MTHTNIVFFKFPSFLTAISTTLPNLTENSENRIDEIMLSITANNIGVYKL